MDSQAATIDGVARRSILPAAAGLPRGPHGLTRAQVAGSQRARLMRAFTELMAERGYAGVRVGDLVARAGVSRSTFYEHFAGKEECLLAAYDRFAAAVGAAITPELDEDAPWHTFVAATVDGYLALLQHDLVAARAFLVEMAAAGPQARERRHRAVDAFASQLAQRHARIRAREGSLGALPPRAYRALALAVRELVHDLLEREPLPELRELAGDITLLTNAVVHGAAAAAGNG
jgi:AcrR family transcriptional regulator